MASEWIHAPIHSDTCGARSAHDFLADLAEFFATIDETAPIVVGIVIVRAIEHVVEVDVQQTSILPVLLMMSKIIEALLPMISSTTLEPGFQ